jgi:tight adherence protein C
MEIWAISLDAGHSLDNAIVDGALSLRRAFPQFSRAMLAVHGELRAGKGRPEVFAELARRSGEPELRKVCRLLIDSERFGTSLAPALRAHARYMRNRMRQQAQESARKVGVKLVFPIFFLVFPSVMLITLGPAVLRIFSTLKPMLDGR